jgi:hypothetical protein
MKKKRSGIGAVHTKFLRSLLEITSGERGMGGYCRDGIYLAPTTLHIQYLPTLI